MTYGDPTGPCLGSGLRDIPDTIVNACTMSKGGNYLVMMPNPCLPAYRSESYAKLLCHEQGHVNGWPGDHPL